MSSTPLGQSGERMFLTTEGLTQLGLAEIPPEHVQKMDSVDYIDELQKIGQKVAQRDVKSANFDGFV